MTALNTPMLTAALGSATTLEKTALQEALGSTGNGAYRGSTVAGELSLRNRRPRMLFAKLFANQSAPTALRVVIFGDSLATAKIQQVLPSLSRKFGTANLNSANLNGTFSPGLQRGGGLDLLTSTGVTTESGKHEYGFTGNPRLWATGSTATLGVGGVNAAWSKISIGYFREPGAGTITVSIGGAAQTPVSAAGAFGWQTIEYTQTSAQTAISISVTGGPVRTNLLIFENSALGGPVLYYMGLGGLSIANAMGHASSAALLQQILAYIAPDLITFEMDDELGTNEAMTAGYQSWASATQAAAPWADKLIFGGTPQSSGTDAVKLTQSRYLRADIAARDESWLYWDGYSAIGSEPAISEIFGAYDGKHPPASLQAFAGEALADWLGLNTFNLGPTVREVLAPGGTSWLGKSTVFGPRGIHKYEVDNNDFQGWWRTSYSFGVSNWNGSNCKFQISYIGSYPTILPDNYKLGSASSTFSFEPGSSTGKTIYELKNSAAKSGTGGHAIYRMIPLPAQMTTVQATADVPANSHPGALVHLTDGPLGAGAYMAGPTISSDWRRVVTMAGQITSPEATDLATTITLLNEIRSKINAALS